MPASLLIWPSLQTILAVASVYLSTSPYCWCFVRKKSAALVWLCVPKPAHSNAQHQYVRCNTWSRTSVSFLESVWNLHITYRSMAAASLHAFFTRAHCARSRMSQSIQPPSVIESSDVTYDSSWVWGQTNARILFKISSGRITPQPGIGGTVLGTYTLWVRDWKDWSSSFLYNRDLDRIWLRNFMMRFSNRREFDDISIKKKPHLPHIHGCESGTSCALGEYAD